MQWTKNVIISSLLSTHPNIGGGLAICCQNPQRPSEQPSILFETAMSLPDSHRAIFFDPSFEASSTDNERLMLLRLGIQTARRVLELRYPSHKKFLDIRTDSSALEHQVNLANSRHLKVTVEVAKILKTLREWGHPWSLTHHKRDQPIAKLADALTRIFYPPLSPRGKKKICRYLGFKPRYAHIDPTQLIVHAKLPHTSSGPSPTVYVLPMNLNMTMYCEALAKLTVLKPQLVLCPFLKLVSGALQVKYHLKVKLLVHDFLPQHTECSFPLIPHGFYVLGTSPQARYVPPGTRSPQAVATIPQFCPVTAIEDSSPPQRSLEQLGTPGFRHSYEFPCKRLIGNASQMCLTHD